LLRVEGSPTHSPGMGDPGKGSRSGDSTSARRGSLRSPAWKRWLSLKAYGLVTSSLFRARTPPGTLRSRFERFSRSSRQSLQRKYPGLTFEDHRADSLRIESVKAAAVHEAAAPRPVILHLHGGAFVFGSLDSYRNRAMRLSHRFEAEVFLPEYRLAPEHPFPAALDDAVAAYEYVSACRPDEPIIVTGDSGGGGLAASLLIRARELGRPMAAGAILLSPWADLSVSGASVETNHSKDRWLEREHLENWARYYVGKTDPRTPLMSPVFADLSGLPPLLVLVGEDELLLDDAKRLVDSARRSGTDARLLVGERMQHDWPLTLPWLEESRAAWKEMRSFVDERSHAAIDASRVTYGHENGRATG
jgi:epsilon-lactone hydrolase